MKFGKTVLFAAAVFLAAGPIQAQNVLAAVLKGDLAQVKAFLEQEPRLPKMKISDQRDSTLLHFAARSDQAEIAALLIDKGADINALNRDNRTPLMEAGMKVTRLLVERGADINLITPDGVTALSYAVEADDKDVFEYLLDRGAKLPKLGSYGADRAIEFGVRNGNLNCLESYGLSRIDALFRNEARMTLAHFAAESGTPEFIARLAELGAPAGEPDIYGWTPLHTAASKGNLPVVRWLVQRGVDKNARTVDGKTPFLLAREENRTETADYLISVGADQGPARPPELSGPYFGKKLPGKTPEPFIVGLQDIEKGLHSTWTFSPDGREVFWKPVWSPLTAIHGSQMVRGRWTKDAIARFSAENLGDDAPFISPDGKKMFFLSQRPVTTKELPFPYVEKIWVMDKIGDGWSEPQKLPEIVNGTAGMHWQISADGTGNLYFGAAGGKIYRAAFRDGRYGKPEPLGDSVNNERTGNFSPCIAPDGSYLLFSRVVPLYSYQMFLSFRKPDGTWTEAVNLSEYLKKPYSLNPRVTADGKYFFFTGRQGVTYWMEAGFIEELRPKG